jgi:hypothetical protein
MDVEPTTFHLDNHGRFTGARIAKALGLVLATLLFLSGIGWSLSLVFAYEDNPNDNFEPLLLEPEVRVFGRIMAAIFTIAAVWVLWRLRILLTSATSRSGASIHPDPDRSASTHRRGL